ncbi:MAG: response regulator [Acidobacteria bacterium]|nr:response regulator [Acidobacteriota bacterium]
MARILLVEDDPDQRLLRRLILERAGYEVNPAASPAEALTPRPTPPDCVLMDLRLPQVADGLQLIRSLRLLHPNLPIAVLSGRTHELDAAPESQLVQATLAKPIRTEMLLKTLARLTAALALLLLLPWAASAQSRDFSFQLPAPAEVIAQLTLASPGSDWSIPSREAATALLTLDQTSTQQVTVFGTPQPHTYTVFLGPLRPGPHTLHIERDPKLSAANSPLEIAAARFESILPSDPRYLPLAHAPVLLPRADTVGRFSDTPLLAYYTRGADDAGPWLEYTVIFSNEDGGTSTRDLMARWGRTTDIEYLYRVWLDPQGRPSKTLIQTREHKDVPYEGRREALHPILCPVTEINMVEPAPAGPTPIRYQLVPVFADLAQASREIVMDHNPLTYRISAQELIREDKLRPPATPGGDRISDPRLYLIVEAKVASERAAIQLLVRRRNSTKWTGSATGIGKDYIERSGWVRATIELPRGTRLSDIAEIGAQCLSRRDLERQPIPKNGLCRLEAFGKVFFLGNDYTPQPPLKLPNPNWQLQIGEMETLSLP